MDNLEKAILERLYIKPAGFKAGVALFLCNLAGLVFIPDPPLLLKLDMLLIIGGLLLLQLRPNW